VDGRQREIIGVLPRGFRLLDRDAALYLPLQFDPAESSSATSATRARPAAARA
jgi:hypothetical protein